MRASKFRVVVWFAASIFTFLSVFPSFLMAEDSSYEVFIRVTDAGFFDAEGKTLNNLVKVPKERNIKLIFEVDGKPGERHAFVLLFDSDEEIESGTIDDQNRRTQIEFTSGEADETYDVFCVLPYCDGMEHLIDLVIIAI